jgi:alkanesulfonate monooxygenase
VSRCAHPKAGSGYAALDRRDTRRVHQGSRPLRTRITTLVRDTTGDAWRDAEEKVAAMGERAHTTGHGSRRSGAVGQQRLLDLAARGDVLDECLYTAPGRFGGSPGSPSWPVPAPDRPSA